MTQISLARVMVALDAIVAEKPEGYRYEYHPQAPKSCVYTAPDGGPSCIVGHVLEWFGIQRPAWPVTDNTRPWWHEDMAKTRDYFTEEANEHLRRVQVWQDAKTTWKDAIR